MNKTLLSFIVSFFFFVSIFAYMNEDAHARSDRRVRGYVKQNGTVVQPYSRTKRDKTFNNNYSTRGNANPYHGKRGTKPRDEDYGKKLRKR